MARFLFTRDFSQMKKHEVEKLLEKDENSKTIDEVLKQMMVRYRRRLDLEAT